MVRNPFFPTVNSAATTAPRANPFPDVRRGLRVVEGDVIQRARLQRYFADSRGAVGH